MRNKTAKTLIVTPYLDNLGGGERYMFSIASALESTGQLIYFSWNSLERIKKITKEFNLKLTNPLIDPEILSLYKSSSALKMYLRTKAYDYVFYLSDGSIPFLGGKKNIIHFQVPFSSKYKSIKNAIKLTSIDRIIVNSRFTKHYIDKSYNVNSTVLYPPAELLKPGKKINAILSVGRFESSLNIKKQDILIEAFKTFSKGNKSWKLILAGSTNDTELIRRYKKLSTGLNIDLVTNPSHKDLTYLYETSKIYWSGTGYGVSENTNPELTEHFGISIVEAATAGCVPLFVPRGGTTEIINDQDFHWTGIQELVDKTTTVINNPSIYQDKLSHVDFSKYSYKAFKSNILKLIS